MSDFRKRILEPALIPLAAFAFIGALAYAVSRILLAVTTEGSVVVAMLLAGCVLFAAGAVAKSGTLKGMQKVALVAFALLLFGSGIAVEASLGPREVEAHTEVAATLIAQGLEFDTDTFSVPADHAFGLELDNRDTDPHNVSIYTEKGGDQLFTFTPFPGPASRVFESGEEGIPEGVYYFQCDVHPSMAGTATAGEATAAPPGGDPGSGPPPDQGTALALAAANTAFDQSTLSFPAGGQVTLTFDNKDALPHNWALYRDAGFTVAIFNGEIFTGPGERKYAFAAPNEAGTYFFKCDVHPVEMRGTATVT